MVKQNHFQDYTNYIAEKLRNTVVTLRDGSEIGQDAGIERWCLTAKAVRDEKGGTLYFIGNGASATIAEHMILDTMKAGGFKTGSCAETSYLTAICNDISSDELFSFKLERVFTDRDMLVTTSSSGNSPNVIKAIETARKKGGYIVTLSGMKPDNKSRSLGDLNFYVPAETYGTTEVCHADLMHCWLDAFLDEYEGGRR
ncbi:MAG: SIS domain-containing protein [Planctomycetaceae bacterium]|jgi:D-sedoheptulose 7-phosphate isomerase|nr:SIS domain-containing protein [Planctomycetaceae bacterium]